MDVTKLPFNEFIGLKLSDEPNYLLMLDDRAEYLNHLNTVHAGALFTLAEATSGHYLLGQFNELPDIVPVVRKVEIKYRKPAIGARLFECGVPEYREKRGSRSTGAKRACLAGGRSQSVRPQRHDCHAGRFRMVCHQTIKKSRTALHTTVRE